MTKTIFIIDDNSTNLTAAEDVLQHHYRVIALSSAAQMFKALDKFKPDLILLDIEMPEVSGFKAMEWLRSAASPFKGIPVIFLTSLADEESEAHGIKLGAVDFIVKPFSKPVLLNRIKNHLDIDELISERTAQLMERTEQLMLLQSGIVHMLADIVETRDEDTGGHIDRTSVLVKIIIDAMIEQHVYVDELLEWDLETVISSTRLHDIGKIAISDTILNKPGRLTEDEFTTMKTHTTMGEKIIDQTILRTGNAAFLQYAKLAVAYHHERWDGSGYPRGLCGTDIPLLGRIMTIVDVYDALISKRPYKEPFSHEEAVRIIMEESGKVYDPLIAEVFYKINKKIKSSAKLEGSE